jgi:hypothetical protein
MSTPKPNVTPAPLPAEIDPSAQAKADEASRKSKERQQSGVTSIGTILTAGLDDETNTKKNNLGA